MALLAFELAITPGMVLTIVNCVKAGPVQPRCDLRVRAKIEYFTLE